MPATLRIESPGLDRMLARMGPQYGDEVRRETVRRYAPGLARALAVLTPRQGPGRTGNMGRSWQVFPNREGTGIVIQNRASYSGFVDRGTRPHRIPKTGWPGRDRKVLRWRTARRGPVSAFRAVQTQASGRPGALARRNFVFTGRPVMHPGTKPQRIVARSVESTIGFLRGAVQGALHTVMARFGGSVGG